MLWKKENSMIYTTLKKIAELHPCEDSWEKALRILGKTEADDEPIAMADILEQMGLDDALYCLRSLPEYDSEWRLFAIWCVRQVEHLLSDQRSKDALDVAERYANWEATKDELLDAGAAAWAAAREAAGEAAWAAARAAARAAAGAAARAVAGEAARAAAWAAAGEAAGEAAGAAARAAAGEAAGEAVGKAAWAAAREAAWKLQSAKLREIFSK